MAVIELTKDNFQSQVVEYEGKVLVDFWAVWCGPCMMVSPLVDEIAEEHPEFKVCKVNCDEEMELAQQFGIMSIPSLLVFENGELVRRQIGAVPKDAILKLLQGAN